MLPAEGLCKSPAYQGSHVRQASSAENCNNSLLHYAQDQYDHSWGTSESHGYESEPAAALHQSHAWDPDDGKGYTNGPCQYQHDDTQGHQKGYQYPPGALYPIHHEVCVTSSNIMGPCSPLEMLAGGQLSVLPSPKSPGSAEVEPTPPPIIHQSFAISCKDTANLTGSEYISPHQFNEALTGSLFRYVAIWGHLGLKLMLLANLRCWAFPWTLVQVILHCPGFKFRRLVPPMIVINDQPPPTMFLSSHWQLVSGQSVLVFDEVMTMYFKTLQSG